MRLPVSPRSLRHSSNPAGFRREDALVFRPDPDSLRSRRKSRRILFGMPDYSWHKGVALLLAWPASRYPPASVTSKQAFAGSASIFRRNR